VTAARVAGAVLVLVVVGAYAALAVRWTATDPGWYAALPRPAWQPPDVVFGVIWPLNFVALCVSGLAVVSQAAPRDIAAWLALLVASVAFAVGWAHAFYVPHHLGRAAVLLACAAILTWLLVVVTHGLVAWAGWVLVPYAVWLTVATSLAVGYWQLVPSSAAPGS
jgi:tryptophan-rich sensory protein